jgi:AcrR family transcriptional regulator
MPEGLGLRGRKIKATRIALIGAAMRLFTKRGFESVTIEQVCATARVSPRTFYRYFGTKEQVVLHDAPLYRQAFTSILDAPELNEHHFTLARRAALAVAREIAAQREDLAPRVRLVEQSPLLIAAWGDLDRFWRDRLVTLFRGRGQADPDLLASAIVGGLNAALARFLASDRESAEALTARVFELFSFGHDPRPRRVGTRGSLRIKTSPRRG